MALKDEFPEESCYTTEQGTPTLTIEQEDRQTIIPWISFRHAVWKEECIQLHFHRFRVDVSGSCLDELWAALQRQIVLTMRRSNDTQAAGCAIRSLKAILV